MEAAGDAKRPRLAESVTAASAGSGEWAQVISALQPAIVALRVTFVRTYEEDPAAATLGTGFVVDKTRGIILTNRHITGVGPVRATAIFDRHEELEVEVLYRDPVHDFGFFRYDPGALRLTRGAEVPLDPSGLRVGAEIRVVGNDAGEKLQILSGTIARVDRNVPEFSTIYNDENTFYAGAGAGTSGGSSGSPVLNQEGRAIALNAAGQEGAASAYFLPLERVDFALRRLQAGEAVPRGTCMAAFLFKPFDELIRVGLNARHELDVRAENPDAIGMLIVDSVLSDQRLLRPGDILLRLEGKVCVGFVQLEAALDDRVGGSVKLLLCRAGQELELEVPVADLHALIPRSFVELGLDVLHGLGYHAARRAHLPLDGGLYLARSGFVFDSLGCGRAALVTAVNGKPTPTAEAFVAAIADVPDRQYVSVSWYELSEFRRDRTLKTGFAKMARAWSPLRLWNCQEGGKSGGPERWIARDLPQPSGVPRAPAAALPQGFGAGCAGGDRLVRQLQASLVTVRFRTDRRFCTEAGLAGCAEGAGLLVDAERGLVLTDRHSAPQSLGDVEVTLAGVAAVDGEVRFIHPMHNLALVQCDPVALASLRKSKVPLRAAPLATGAKGTPRPGEELYFVGFDNQGNVFSARVTVAAVYMPSGKDEFPLWDVPRFRERNLEIVVLADTPEDTRGGVLCDRSGCVRALFAAFDWQGSQREETTEAFGIPTNVFTPWVAAMRSQAEEDVRIPSLDVEVNAIDVATLARGTSGSLPKEWLQAVGRHCARQGQVARAIKVHRVLPSGASDGRLLTGDVLLSVAGKTIACGLDMEIALWNWQQARLSGAAGSSSTRGRGRSASGAKAKARGRGRGSAGAGAAAGAGGGLGVRVLRAGAEVDLELTPTLLESEDDSRLVIWAGLVLRHTPRCILERCGENVARLAGGVFIQNVLGGSPADTRELMPHCFLLEIDGHALKELGDVVDALRAAAAASSPAAAADAAASSEAAGRRWVRLRLLDLFGQEHVRALQCDPLFFPTMELRRQPRGRWQCAQH